MYITTLFVFAAAIAIQLVSGLVSSSPANLTRRDNQDNFNDFALYAHNYYREYHSVEAFTWDQRLTDIAAEIASTCFYGHDQDRDGGGYGQNIAYNASTAFTPNEDLQTHFLDSINIWYNEAYEFEPYYGAPTPPLPPQSPDYLHYTQMAWAGSQKVGCATQSCPRILNGAQYQAYYTVCNYDPPGNIIGEFDQNVFVPSWDE